MILKGTYSAHWYNLKRLGMILLTKLIRFIHVKIILTESFRIVPTSTALYSINYTVKYRRIRATYRMILYKIRFSSRYNLHGTIQYNSVSSNRTKLTKTVQITHWYHFERLPQGCAEESLKIVPMWVMVVHTMQALQGKLFQTFYIA